MAEKTRQDDPKGQKLVQTKDDIITGVNYTISVGKPSVVIDSHMHIQSGNCATLPFLWAQTGPLEVIRMERETIEGAGNFATTCLDYLMLKPAVGEAKKIGHSIFPPKVPSADQQELYRKHALRQTLEVSQKKTHQIGFDFVKKEKQKADDFYAGEPLYKDVPRLTSICIVMTMDMEYAHIDGYFGLKACNVIYKEGDPEKKPVRYWTPTHGRLFKDNRSAEDIYMIGKNNPFKLSEIEEQTEGGFKENSKTMKSAGMPGIYYDKENQPNDISIMAAPCLLPASETTLYEQWKDQLFRTELAAAANPLKLLPLFHYDPRRWQVKDYKDYPFDQLEGSGIFLGFKMYTAQGYRPWDVERLPILKDFYKRCCEADIPILNHCTPEGAPSFDRGEYIKFQHPMDKGEEAKKKGKSGLEYFNERFVSPAAWRQVLEAERSLTLCLAHFGGGTKLGLEWFDQIFQMIQDYPNVYTDISSSMTNDKFKENLKKHLSDKSKREKIRKRIIFGTDWYLTLFADRRYDEYCKETKAFLDEIDTSLWIRFTQANPYEFYKLNLNIRRIAENLIKMRQENEKVLKELGEELDPEKIAKIKKEAAYIEAANSFFMNL